MSEQTIEIYKYTHLHGGWVEYSADDDKYSDERFIDVVRKEYITVSDLEFLNLPRWCASLATSQPPAEKPSNASSPQPAQRGWVDLNAEDCNRILFQSKDVADAIARTSRKLVEKNT